MDLFNFSLESFWRELLLFLCKPIYQLIVYLYELFEVVGTAEIITNETLSTIYNRIGLLLGIYMMFRVLLSFIQMLINPDYISDKEKGIGNIAKKAILVVVLLGITPFVFDKAMELQNYIVGVNNNENVIAKLIFPKEIIKSENFGNVLSASLFESFYRYDDTIPEDVKENEGKCQMLELANNNKTILYNHVVSTGGNINAAKICLEDTWKVDNNESRYTISFTSNGVFAIIVGAVVCYVLMTYTLMVGARVIQLAFLRMIAPMAILGYLSPKKDGMFEKWLKMCTTTYIDLFIRMAIIFFVVFIIDAIIGTDGTGIALARDFEHMWIVNIVMILALLLFAKKAPNLLKELFPSSGAASLGYGIKSAKNLFGDMLGGSTIYKGLTTGTKTIAKGATAGAAIGLFGGVASGISRTRANLKNGKGIGKSVLGGIGGFATALPRGLKAGTAKGNVFTNISKGITNQRSIDDKYDQLITSGGSTLGKVRSTLTSYFGETKGQMYTRQLNNLDKIDGYKKDIQGFADEISFVKAAKDSWEQMTQLDGETIKQYEARKSQAFTRYKKLQAAVIDASMDKNFDVNKLSINGVEYTDYLRDKNGDIVKDKSGNNVKIKVRIPSENTKITDDDKIYASDIKAKQREANSFIDSHNVEYWDDTTKEYKTMSSLNNKSELGKAADNAHITKTHILGPDENYHQAIANDKAAGVDSGATKNK